MASVRRRLVSEPGSVFSISCSNGPVMPAPAGRCCDPDRSWGHNPELRWCAQGPRGLKDQVVNPTEAGVHHKTNTPWHTLTQTHEVTRKECVRVCGGMKIETGKQKEWEREICLSHDSLTKKHTDKQVTLHQKYQCSDKVSHCTRAECLKHRTVTHKGLLYHFG